MKSIRLQTIKSWVMPRFKKMLAAVNRHEDFLLSGSLAYTIALALAPFVMIMLTLLALLGPEAQHSLVEQLTSLLGSQAGEALKAVTENAERERHFAGLSGLISFLIIAVSASAIFSQLRIALDKINDYQAPEQESGGWRGLLKDRVFSVGLVFGFILLMIVSMAVTTGMSVVFHGGEGIFWQALAAVCNLLVFTVLFSAIFRFVPTERLPWSRCAISGLTATLFFLAGKAALGLYLGRSAVGSAYGAAGSLVVLLVWLYYMSLTLLLSYEFSIRVLGLEKKSRAERRNRETFLHF